MLKKFTWLSLLCFTFFFVQFRVQAANITDFKVPRGFSFSKDLIKGTNTIPDTYFLQNLLNMSTSTRVSESGSGSNGKLTSYYGDRTESAVGRFQNIFKTDIGYEKSISTNPGASSYKLDPEIVDQYTRAVMNKLIIIYQEQLDKYNSTKNSSTTATVLPFSSSTTFKTGVDKKDEKSDPEKTGFKYSPQGVLLKLVGGNELVDKVYSYTPSGMLGGGSSGSGGSGASSFSVGGFGSGGSSGGTSAAITPFGGLVTSMTTCTCSFNLLLYVKDVRGTVLPLMYQPGATMLYKMYTPTSGVNVLGTYTSGGTCLIYAGTTCSTGGTPVGTMIQLGTSAL